MYIYNIHGHEVIVPKNLMHVMEVYYNNCLLKINIIIIGINYDVINVYSRIINNLVNYLSINSF